MTDGAAVTADIALPTIVTTPTTCAYIQEFLKVKDEAGTDLTLSDFALDTTTVPGKLRFTVSKNDAYIGHNVIEQTFKATDKAGTAMTAPKYNHKLTLSVTACENSLTNIGTCSGWSGTGLSDCKYAIT